MSSRFVLSFKIVLRLFPLHSNSARFVLQGLWSRSQLPLPLQHRRSSCPVRRWSLPSGPRTNSLFSTRRFVFHSLPLSLSPSLPLSLSPSLPLFGSKLTPRIRQVELDRSTLISSMLESHSPRLRETFTNLGRPLVDPAEDGLRRTLPSPNGIFPPTSSLPSSPKLLSNVDKLRVDSTLRLRSLETSSSRPTSTAIIWWMVDRRRTPIPNVSFALFLFLLFADFTFRRQSPSPVPTISLERTDELERLLAFPTDS